MSACELVQHGGQVPVVAVRQGQLLHQLMHLVDGERRKLATQSRNANSRTPDGLHVDHVAHRRAFGLRQGAEQAASAGSDHGQRGRGIETTHVRLHQPAQEVTAELGVRVVQQQQSIERPVLGVPTGTEAVPQIGEKGAPQQLVGYSARRGCGSLRSTPSTRRPGPSPARDPGRRTSSETYPASDGGSPTSPHPAQQPLSPFPQVAGTAQAAG
jgi:hypothetical protein